MMRFETFRATEYVRITVTYSTINVTLTEVHDIERKADNAVIDSLYLACRYTDTAMPISFGNLIGSIGSTDIRCSCDDDDHPIVNIVRSYKIDYDLLQNDAYVAVLRILSALSE